MLLNTVLRKEVKKKQKRRNKSWHKINQKLDILHPQQ